VARIRGSSNAKAKRELGWEPRHKSWREGFTADDGGEASRRSSGAASTAG